MISDRNQQTNFLLTVVLGIIIVAMLAGLIVALYGAQMALLATFIMVIAIILFASFQFGFLIVLCLVPFSNFIGSYIQITGISVGGVVRDGLIVLLMLIWVVRSIAMRSTGSEPLSFPRWMVIVFMVIVGLYIFWAENTTTALLGFRNTALFALMLFVTESMIQTRRDLYRLLSVMVLIFSIFALIGVGESLTDGEFLTTLGWDANYSGITGDINDRLMGVARATGGIGNATDFGVFEMFACLMLSMFLINKPTNGYPKILVFCLGLITAAVIASLTRTAWFGLIAGVIYAIIILRQWRLILIPFVLGMVYAFMSIYAPDNLYFQRLISADPASVTNTMDRLTIYQTSLTVVEDNPLGLGLGTQGSGARDPNYTVSFTKDSYFLQLLIEGGFPLVGSYFIMLVFLIIETITIFRRLRDPVLKSVAVGVNTVLVSVIAVNFASASMDSRIINFYFWILVGIVYSLTRLDRQVVSQER